MYDSKRDTASGEGSSLPMICNDDCKKNREVLTVIVVIPIEVTLVGIVTDAMLVHL